MIKALSKIKIEGNYKKQQTSFLIENIEVFLLKIFKRERKQGYTFVQN